RCDSIGPSRSSPSCYLVLSVTSESKPTTDEDSLVPHRVFSRRDRPKKDQNPRVLTATPPSSLVSSVGPKFPWLTTSKKNKISSADAKKRTWKPLHEYEPYGKPASTRRRWTNQSFASSAVFKQVQG
ncbi:unnamed protein product, partial [Brassica rapa]